MAATEIIKKRRKILFMLNLTALPRILKTSATWMQSRWGKGAFLFYREPRGDGKKQGFEGRDW
jgi:hypothetical protein